MRIIGVKENTYENGYQEWILYDGTYELDNEHYIDEDVVEVYYTPQEMFEDFQLALYSNPKNY